MGKGDAEPTTMQAVISVLARLTRRDPMEVRADSTLIDDLAMDSLDLYELYVFLEDTTGVAFDEGTLSGIATVRDVYEVLNERYETAPQCTS